MGSRHYPQRNKAISAAKAKNRAAGIYQGGRPPFGYKVANGKLVEVLEQQEVLKALKRIAVQIKSGSNIKKSRRAIAEQLELALEIKISHMTVSRLLNKFLEAL